MPGYVFAELKVIDQAAYEQYRDMARTSIAEYGGTYALRTGITREPLEGEWADEDVFVMIEFETVDRAREWYTSDSYAPALKIAPKAMKRRVALYDSVPPTF